MKWFILLVIGGVIAFFGLPRMSRGPSIPAADLSDWLEAAHADDAPELPDDQFPYVIEPFAVIEDTGGTARAVSASALDDLHPEYRSVVVIEKDADIGADRTVFDPATGKPATHATDQAMRVTVCDLKTRKILARCLLATPDIDLALRKMPRVDADSTGLFDVMRDIAQKKEAGHR